MLITESQMNIRPRFSALLESMDYIDMPVSPALVPVVENQRLGSVMINLEDLTNFAEANDINDLGYALQLVCEASEDIDPNYVSFSIPSYQLIADPSLASLTESLLNQGINVYTMPLSRYDNVSILGEAALDYGMRYDDWSLMEAFINDDMDVFLESIVGASKELALDKVQKHLQAQFPQMPVSELNKQAIRLVNDFANSPSNTTVEGLQQRAANQVEKLMQKNVDRPLIQARAEKELQDWGARTGSDNQSDWESWANAKTSSTTTTTNTDGAKIEKAAEDTKKQVEKMEKYGDVNAVRRFLAKKLAWAHSKAEEFKKWSEKKNDKGNVAWYRKIAGYLAKFIEWLTRKLHNLAAGKNDQIADPTGK